MHPPKSGAGGTHCLLSLNSPQGALPGSPAPALQGRYRPGSPATLSGYRHPAHPHAVGAPRAHPASSGERPRAGPDPLPAQLWGQRRACSAARPGPGSRCHQPCAPGAGSRGDPLGSGCPSRCRGGHPGAQGPPRCPELPGGCSGALPASSPPAGPAVPGVRGARPAGPAAPRGPPWRPAGPYHAVRRGLAVTEPGCRLPSPLMSEPLRCRQPHSRHRLRRCTLSAAVLGRGRAP